MPTLPLLLQRLGPVSSRGLDLIVALSAGLLCWYAAATTPAGSLPKPAWLAVLVGLLFGLPLLVRRRWPIPSAVVIAAVGAVVLGTAIIPDYASPAPVSVAGVAAFTVGRRSDGRRGAEGALAMVVLLVTGTVTAAVFSGGSVESPGLPGVLFTVMVTGSGWAIGWTLRERRRRAEEAIQQNTVQAVTAERLRIARDMHDAVGHSLSLIAVKSGVANHVAKQRPEAALEALAVIETESRSALAELRRVVGALRTELNSEPEYAPPPTLDDLGRLADNAQSSGVSVRLEVRGGEGVPEPLALIAYRIVQESLTNVVRHAAPASCRVDVEGNGDSLRISITDDGTRHLSTRTGTGAGLTGMRERVSAYGGTFSAGPRAEGGFTVVAMLPYGATS